MPRTPSSPTLPTTPPSEQKWLFDAVDTVLGSRGFWEKDKVWVEGLLVFEDFDGELSRTALPPTPNARHMVAPGDAARSRSIPC